jgi:hypothetical protein
VFFEHRSGAYIKYVSTGVQESAVSARQLCRSTGDEKSLLPLFGVTSAFCASRVG